jgi:K+-transporting ATPase KdpF subunit
MRASTSQGDCEQLGSVWTPRELRFAGNESMASYVLVAVVIVLVIYLFYAVINPEKF